MRSPVLIALATSALAFIAACGASEEELPGNAASTTATSAPTATVPLATPTRSPAPPASTVAVPADWSRYSDHGGLFEIRYPKNWFQSAGQAQFSSYDLSTLTTVQRPREALVVEVTYSTAAGISSCGSLSVDPKSSQESPNPSATPTSLGGVPAWEIARTEGDPTLEADLTRAQTISVIYQGYCLVVAGYFTQQAPDVDTFLQVASSFEFTF